MSQNDARLTISLTTFAKQTRVHADNQTINDHQPNSYI